MIRQPEDSDLLLESSRLTLLPISAEQGYIYWQINHQALDAQKYQCPHDDSAILVCRIVTQPNALASDDDAFTPPSIVESRTIETGSSGFFFRFAAPNINHYAEVGLLSTDGNYTVLIRSNIVRSLRYQPGHQSPSFVRLEPDSSGKKGFISAHTAHRHSQGHVFPKHQPPLPISPASSSTLVVR